MSILNIEKDNGKYAQCNFCLSKNNVYKVQGRGRAIIVSMCETCIEEIYKTTIKPTTMFTAKEIKTITVTDPDRNYPVEITLFKHEQSNGIFAIDTSYIEQVFDDDEIIIINDPFNSDYKVKLLV